MLNLDILPTIGQRLKHFTLSAIVLWAVVGSAIAQHSQGPTESEVRAFYQENPHLFSRRKIYSFSQYSLIDTTLNKSAIETLLHKSIDQVVFEARLQSIGGFTKTRVTRAAEQLPLKQLTEMANLKKGQGIVTLEGNVTKILYLEDSVSQPVSLQMVATHIRTFLINAAKTSPGDTTVLPQPRRELDSELVSANDTSHLTPKVIVDQQPTIKPEETGDHTKIAQARPDPTPAASQRENLTPEELRFLKDPMSAVSLCTSQRSAAFQCGSSSLEYRAREQISSPIRRDRDAAADALALIFLAKATVINESVTCAGGACNQKSRFRCEREDELMLSLMQSGMSRAMYAAKSWQESSAASNLGMKIEQAPPSDHGFKNRSKRMLMESFHAELRPVSAELRRVSIRVGWGASCDEFFEFGSSVTVSER